MTPKLGQGKHKISLEHLVKSKRKCSKNEGTCQKGTKANMGLPMAKTRTTEYQNNDSNELLSVLIEIKEMLGQEKVHL